MQSLISCHPGSFGRSGTRAAIEHLPGTGLHHLELPVCTAGSPTESGHPPLVTEESTEAELRDIEQLLAAHEVTVSSCNLVDGNPLDPAELLVARRKLDVAARFGVPVVVCHAGSADDADERKQLYRHLRQLGEHAGSLGIVCCFDTRPGLCGDDSRMFRTMQELDHPQLKLNFDTAGILYHNRLVTGEIALAKVCHHVRHVHLSDSAGEFQQWYFPALGLGGAVDFVRVLELLRVCGFRGPYSIELNGIEGEPELSLSQTVQRVTDSVSYLRQCGYFDQLPG